MVRFSFFGLITSLLIAVNSFSQELPVFITDNSISFTLQVHGLNKVEGELRIAMFDSKEAYTKEPVFAVVLPVEGDEVEWNVPDLPYGEYAIAVYHDKNNNGKLDTNFLGIPKEEYGFSNNARGKFGPASWEDAKFSISKQSFTHLIIID